MIKAELIARIAEQNPHIFNKDVKRAVYAISTRSKQHWSGAIALSCEASAHSL
jgi:hypothetical protein